MFLHWHGSQASHFLNNVEGFFAPAGAKKPSTLLNERAENSHTVTCAKAEFNRPHPLDTPQSKHYSMEALRTMFQVLQIVSYARFNKHATRPFD